MRIVGTSWQRCLGLPKLFHLGRNDGQKQRSWRIALLYVYVAPVPQPFSRSHERSRILADSQICRLLLYSSEAPKVLTPFHVHLKRFGDLSRGWGIGEETFEYWSSLSRQYRIFAELLEMAQADNLRIPYPSPPTLPTAPPVGVTPSLEFFATPISSGNPLQVLQQPAYYYYAAADCTLQRKVRFDEALAVEEDAKESEAGGHISMAPGFANEKKVDHSELAIEVGPNTPLD